MSERKTRKNYTAEEKVAILRHITSPLLFSGGLICARQVQGVPCLSSSGWHPPVTKCAKISMEGPPPDFAERSSTETVALAPKTA